MPMDFDAIVRKVQEDDPSRTEADIQADIDWLVEHGFIDVEWVDDDGNVLTEAAGLH